ncbi:MAG: para-aminobenzoate synthetase component 1 [Pseudohongiellaceae bacterium]|jgi:para-aminobenzoate synthetase component 1
MMPALVLPAPPGPPLLQLAAVADARDWPLLLDSGPEPRALSGWHYFVVDPLETLALDVGDGVEPRAEARALGLLQDALDRHWPGSKDAELAAGEELTLPPGGLPLPPFQGGAVTVLSFDLGRQLERLPAIRPRDSSWPDLLAGVYRFVLAEEVASGRRVIVGRGSQVQAAQFAARIQQLGDRAAPVGEPLSCEHSPTSSFSRSDYLAAVDAAREHILAGNIYQVNLSQRFLLPYAGDAAPLHQALRARSPAPFSALLRTPLGSLVSSSPELFLRRRGGTIESRPIKGTGPRSADPVADAASRAALERSPKETAELAMIVDLVRNDLGRLAEVGSVAVTLPFETEAWSTVFHRVATVTARVPVELSAAAIIEAAWPPASVTGTPKLSALGIIEELEPVRRHAYTGALGWIGANGDFDLSVAIRIATLCDERLLINVGGGITLASDPGAEYDETLHKARGWFDVLQLPLPFGETLT